MSNARKLALAAAALGTSSLLLVGTAGIANADGTDTASGAKTRGPLAELVSSGTITKDDLMAVKDALRADREDNKAAHKAEAQSARAAILTTLVSQGTITQAQADAITAASADRGAMRELVTDGTVTRDDLRAIKEALQADRDSDRAAHQAEMKSARDAVLADLVSEGVLTQAQADAIGSALDTKQADRPEKRGGRGPGGHRG